MTDRYHHFERPTADKPGTLISAILVSSAVGLVTGAAGFTIMRGLYPDSPVFLGGSGRNSIKLDLNDPTTYLATAYIERLAGVYSGPLDRTKTSYEQALELGNYLGPAVVVTSDGWLVAGPGLALKDGQSATVFLGNNLYEVEGVKIDSRLKLTFIKVKAVGLTPVKFADKSGLSVGSLVFNYQWSIGQQPIFNKGYVSQSDWLDASSRSNLIKADTDVLYNQAVLEGVVKKGFMFNAAGEIAGLVVEESGKGLRPSDLKVAVDKFLSGSSYVTAGFYYINPPLFGSDSGALVYHQQKAAVVPGGLAFKAGLRSGDRLLAVDNIEVGKETEVSDLLLNYKPGDKAELSIERQGESLKLTIQF